MSFNCSFNAIDVLNTPCQFISFGIIINPNQQCLFHVTNSYSD